MSIPVGIAGANGRMGRTIVELLSSADDLTLAAAVERVGLDVIGTDAGNLVGMGEQGVVVVDTLATVVEQCQVVIDFSHPDATLQNVQTCAEAGRPIVIGTTGITESDREKNCDVGARGGGSIGAEYEYRCQSVLQAVGNCSPCARR